jgi:phosphatidate cytidylyltransferase
MLKQRVITAIALLAILLPAVLYPSPTPFAAVAMVLIAAGAWEWARMNAVASNMALAYAIACAAVCGASWLAAWVQMPMRGLWIAIGSAWVLVGAWLLRAGVAAWRTVPRWLALLGGLLALWAAWLAVFQARVMGVNFLFSVLALVWVADIVAYFCGRALGGRFFSNKLAPSISPGKTWEGAFGGVLGVVACAWIWRWIDGVTTVDSPSLYSHVGGMGGLTLTVAAVFMAAMSIVGDLVESLFKRSAGVKDSSGLLPGHGGVLDRVDALLPILPIAMMLVSI